MAQRTEVILIDDLDGGSAAETVRFALDGSSYEIDLSEQNAREMRDAFARYVGAARRAGGRPATSRPRRGSARTDSAQTTAIRDWARSTGRQVSDRGRISREIMDAWEKAHS